MGVTSCDECENHANEKYTWRPTATDSRSNQPFVPFCSRSRTLVPLVTQRGHRGLDLGQCCATFGGPGPGGGKKLLLPCQPCACRHRRRSSQASPTLDETAR